MKPNDEKLQRVIAFLNREEVDYLDKIGKDAFFTKGTKLSRIKIIRAMIEAIRKLQIDGVNIKTEEDLKNEILKRAAGFAAGELSEKLKREGPIDGGK